MKLDLYFKNMLFLILFLLLVGCNLDQSNITQIAKPINSKNNSFSSDVLNKSAGGLTLFRQYVDNISKAIAQNPALIGFFTKQDWKKLNERIVKISEFEQLSSFSAKYYLDGREYEISLWPYENSNRQNPDKLIIATDPDRFYNYKNGSSFPVFRVNENGYQTDEITVDDLTENELLIIIETRQVPTNSIDAMPINDDDDPGSGGGGGSSDPVPYLCLTNIYLFDGAGQDVSAEEFELFLDKNGGNYEGTTRFVFDGRTITDASGRSVKLKQVVSEEQNYAVGGTDGVALASLKNSTVNIVPIECDDEEGVFSSFAGSGTRKKKVYTYHNDGDYEANDKEFATITVEEESWYDQDDWYNSQYREFTLSNMENYGYPDKNHPLIIDMGRMSLTFQVVYK